MMSKEFLKKIGILGISFGLIASPLAMAGMDDEEYEPQDPAPQEEPAPDVDGNDEFGTTDYDTEYEDEEEEFTFDDEEENEEEEWETPEEDDEEQSW
ncbi:hypothetical protein IEI94_21285 [Halomonas sp. ML-15]|uniref:hypothetical protein n=1 Tax=Halomonas sp. ML-15 TaxID=2773305 RepID=UPI0017472D81|nr:hypothetical protein [Halomonas sp. ML-15]MBD3898394.1 hypothetical protein [Halomonas sp. ML-15]